MTSGHCTFTWIVPSVDAGGIGPVALETATAVAAAGGCEVTLLETHGAPRCDRTDPGGLRRVGLDMAGMQAPPAVVLDWLRENPQKVVFTNGVSHLHEIFPDIPPATAHVAVLHDSARSYRDEVLSCAGQLDAVVAVSDYVFGWAHRDLRAARFSGPIRRIHNGTYYPPPRKRVEHSAPLKLLFIGDASLKGGSRLSGIAKALRRSKTEFQLTVITSEPNQLQDRLVRAAGAERVTFMRRCSRDELWTVYAEHDALLMLSMGEPFGMVTIEAMGMGCVPIGYDVPSGTQEIVEHGVNGLLVSCRHSAVADAIMELARSRGRLQTMAGAAMDRARTVFTAERTAREYVQLAESLIDCGNRSERQHVSAERRALEINTGPRAAIVQWYHALPLSVRRRVRTALSAHPAAFRWLRERL